LVWVSSIDCHAREEKNMARMGFAVCSVGLGALGLKASAGMVYIAFDVGFPVLYVMGGLQSGIGDYQSAGSGFDVPLSSDDMLKGFDDTFFTGLSGQTLGLDIEADPFVGMNNPVKLTFTLWSGGSQVFSFKQMVGASGAFLSDLHVQKNLTNCDMTQWYNQWEYNVIFNGDDPPQPGDGDSAPQSGAYA
jgi:hypothetical protein